MREDGVVLDLLKYYFKIIITKKTNVLMEEGARLFKWVQSMWEKSKTPNPHGVIFVLFAIKIYEYC